MGHSRTHHQTASMPPTGAGRVQELAVYRSGVRKGQGASAQPCFWKNLLCIQRLAGEEGKEMVGGGAHLPIAVFIPMRFALARVTDPTSLGGISVLELKL